MENNTCLCCSHDSFSALPPLPQTIISDGQLWKKPLERKVCNHCGASQHLNELTQSNVNEIYNSYYSLGSQISEADKNRVERYKDWILSAFDKIDIKPPQAFLEVGCGNGLLAKEFVSLWPSADFCGIEPAHQAAIHASSLGLDIHEGTLDDIELDKAPKDIDFMYSVNVIEHTLNPKLFLQQQKTLLSDEGYLLVICPDSVTPNIETLFYDHVTGFTPKSFIELASQSELELIFTETAKNNIGNFQMVVFKKGIKADEPADIPKVDIEAVTKEKAWYLSQWKNLDQSLVEKSQGKNAIVFGASEMASLIRAMAPKFWSEVKFVTVDTPNGKSFHEKDVIALEGLKAEGLYTFIAVRPDYCEGLEKRLGSLGFEVDGIHNYISN